MPDRKRIFERDESERHLTDLKRCPLSFSQSIDVKGEGFTKLILKRAYAFLASFHRNIGIITT